MGWVGALGARLQGWRVTAGLVTGSLAPFFPWRLVTDLMGGLSGYLDIFAIGIVAIQPVLGSETVGLTLAWLLIGWLIYQYTQLLYPSEFEAVVDFKGFRALTALGTLFFGVVLWGSTISEAVPVQVLAGSMSSNKVSSLVSVYLAGNFGGALVFGLYLSRWHPEAIYEEQSDLTAMFENFFPRDINYNPDTIPGRWQSVHRWVRASGYVLLPPIVCWIVGMAAVILNVFYPLPEAAFFIGFVALRVWPDTGPDTVYVPRYEVDLRLVDAISGATRNIKGAFMIFFSVSGMLLSGALFLIFSDLFFALAAPKGIFVVFSPLLLLTLLLAWLFLGMYSMVHWIRQLERIEPYTRQWGDTADERHTEDIEEASLVTRPPGFLLPAHLPIVGGVCGRAIATATESSLVITGVVTGGMSVAVLVMGWGLVWTWRNRDDPQPLTHESRDLLVTILLQFGLTIIAIHLVDWEALLLGETLQIRTDRILMMVLILLLLSAVYYTPETSDWKHRQEGLRKLLAEIHGVIITVLGIALLRLMFEGPTLLVEIFLVGGLVLIIIGTLIDVYLDRLAE